MEKYANIMLLGRSGVGKSSFINYLIGKNVCKVATGMPVTQGFETYIYNTGKIPLRIYDSKGLEVKNYLSQKEEIIKFLSTRCNDTNVFNWLHSIFYCINLEGRRFEPGEVEFIKSIKESISQNVHIIITHCKEESGEPEKDMKEYLRSQLGSEVKIYFVNSVSVKFRNGRIVNQFGRKKVLDEIFRILWRDISLKISNEYSTELHNGYMEMCRKIKNAFEATVGQINTMKVLQEISGSKDVCSEWEDIFTDKERELDSFIENLNKNYQNKIKPLVDFYNSYSECMGCYIQAYNIGDFGTSELFEIDIDRIIDQSKLGKFIEEIDNVSDDDIWGIIGGVIKGGYYLITIKKRFQEIIEDISWELRKSVPSEEQIQKVVYEKLIEQMR